MRKVGLISLALLLLLAGCSYYPDRAVYAADEPLRQTVPEFTPSVESTILTDLEDSLRVDPRSGVTLQWIDVSRDWICLDLTAPDGTALSLLHKGAGLASWEAACALLTGLTAHVWNACRSNGRDGVTVYAFLVSDANPDRVLYALRNGEAVYSAVDDDRTAALAALPERGSFILNTSTKRIHNRWCSSVELISPAHYRETISDVAALQRIGYVRCGQRGDWDVAPSTVTVSLLVGRVREDYTEGMIAP